MKFYQTEVIVKTLGYVYDDNGFMIEKTINSQLVSKSIQYEYINGLLMYESDGVYQITYRYDYDGSLVSFEYDSNIVDQISGSEYYYIRGYADDIQKIIDKNLNTLVSYQYDAYGNIIEISDTSGINLSQKNGFLYRGYRYDLDLGLYLLHSIYYHPVTRSFINSDSILGQMGNPKTHNLQAYTGYNPVMYTDPSGKFPILISLAIIFGIGALSGIVGTFVGDLATSVMVGEWSFSSWETYVGSAIGYGVGAIAVTYLGPTAGLAISGGLSAFAGMSLEKATGTNNRSWEEIALWTAGSAALSAVMGHLSKGLKVSGITADRGGFQHVMRTQFTNMLRHGYNISFKTAAKSFVAMTVSRQITGGLFTGMRRTAIEWWEYFIYGDKEGLRWV